MKLPRAATVWLGGALGFGALFLAAPLLFMAWETVHDGDGFSLAPWRELLADPTDRIQLLASMRLGAASVAVALVLGLGHAWLTHRTDLPGAAVLGPLGALPLVLPPILVAMGFSDFADTRGFFACAMLLGVSHAPFVAVLAARGLRATDGRAYEAALLARGRVGAERWLLRSILPEVFAGCLLAFIFVVSEHGVPEFLTGKGKAWHTYAEGIFAKWTRRNTGVDHAAVASPIVAAVPLVALILVSLVAALRLRGRASRGGAAPLPVRRLGGARWPALLLPAAYLGAGVVVPVAVMGMWAAGSTVVDRPMSFEILSGNFRSAFRELGGDLGYTLGVGGATTAVLLAVSLPLAWQAARRRGWIDHLSILPVAVPGVLLAIGMVKVFNRDLFFDFYDGPGMLAGAYAARFLPFGVLTLSAAVRRIPVELEEAARFGRRSALARGLRVHLPLLLPAIWSAACLIFILALRELDVAVVLPAGNGTVVRRLSNIVHFGGEDMGGALALMLLASAVLVPLLTVVLTGRKLRSLS
ncbi:MAG: ABC transporter permease [Planctomycetota bacterium JB042]